MIKTTTGIEIDYSTLEKILQERLNTNKVALSPLKIRCFERDGNIVVIVEHPEDVLSHPRRIFRVIRSVVQEKKIVGEILMYLVVHGTNKPQFFNQITLYSQPNYQTEIHNQTASVDASDSFKYSQKKEEKQSPLVMIIVVSIMSVLGVAFFVYILNRPCVIGKCLLLSETAQSVNESLSIIAENKEYISLPDIKQQLVESIEKLKTIPAWSKNYSDAEELIKKYQIEINKIDNAIKAIELADKAKLILQQPPVSQTKWQEVAKLWENAISILQEIPDENKNGFFTKKQQEYQENLMNVKIKLQQEEEGQKYLLAAQEAAKLAESRKTLAKSLSNLQQVEATWKAAIERLEKIPLETTAYEKKQELLDAYIPKLLEAQQKAKDEETAINLYNQAINQVQSAKNYEVNNKWASAISSWQNTLNILEQTPVQTFQYQENLKLLNSSRQELTKADAKQKILLVIEQAQNDLKNTCLDNPKICNYSVEPNIIKVFLTNSYIDIINQISNPSSTSNNNNSQQILNHISQVENNLKYISSKYQIPLEVYNPEGNLMTKYQP